jgi:hypothetical protein
MGVDREKMKQDLLNRTKESYDRKDGEAGQNHFDPELEIPFWKPGTTQGKPHIIDTIPFLAGPNFPTNVPRPVREGDFAYVLDLWVHKAVGPGKATVVCPARNYGKRCPVCEDVENLMTTTGQEYLDIPHHAKRQCTYNVLVMDDAVTEAKGVQVWDVSHKYSEKAIASLAISARGGGYIAFSSPEKGIGKSIAFDVAKDKYKTISGHRFEERNYDIPQEILDQAIPLDTIIKIYTAEELIEILYPDGVKPEAAGTGNPPVETAGTGGLRSLRNQGGAPDAGTVAGPGPVRTLKGTAGLTPKTDTCPIGGNYADDHDKYEECKACEKFKACAEALDLKDAARSQNKTAETTQTTTTQAAATGAAATTAGAGTVAPPRRTLLRRPPAV